MGRTKYIQEKEKISRRKKRYPAENKKISYGQGKGYPGEYKKEILQTGETLSKIR